MQGDTLGTALSNTEGFSELIAETIIRDFAVDKKKWALLRFANKGSSVTVVSLLNLEASSRRRLTEDIYVSNGTTHEPLPLQMKGLEESQTTNSALVEHFGGLKNHQVMDILLLQ